ncbi:hypothetical protein H0H87_005756 [Tephrocybe sp. NHM501043]|nr:hypothetical protein H0H87_005756 [Tephrocybe sp. NHM501043]
MVILFGLVINHTGYLLGGATPKTGLIVRMGLSLPQVVCFSFKFITFIFTPQDSIMDAIRVSDGKLVMLKVSSHTDSHEEIPVGKLFSSERLKSFKNHCIPYLDVIDVPDSVNEAFLVLPLLYDIEKAPFETVGEAVDFFHQIFEVRHHIQPVECLGFHSFSQGLEFMHENNVAHG